MIREHTINPGAMPAVSGRQPLIRIEGLSVTFGGGQKAVEDVSLSVSEGEFLLITGPSGCGKTTLARCLNGLIPHLIPGQVKGEIRVAGLNPLVEEVRDMAVRVGMVFQVPEAQLFNLLVEEEVAFGCRNLGLEPAEVERRVEDALRAVGMGSARRRVLHKMSGGEKQLIAIASVLAMQPSVIVLDEPLSSLDGRGVRRVLGALEKLNRDLGITVIVIEHRTHLVAGSAGRIVVMDAGRIILDGGPDIWEEERVLLSRLGIRVPAEHRQDDVPLVRSEPSQAPDIVSVEDVYFGYKGQKVLHGITLGVKRGELLALVGESGAGKTTLAHLIAGALKPSGGSIKTAFGKSRLVGLLLQNPSEQQFCDTVEEEVRFGPENYGLPAEAIVEEMLGCTDMLPYRGYQVQQLSRGQQQRLALASVLALKPEILILDEPTLGQDWGHLTRFMDYIKGLQEAGTTVLLITHDRDVALRYADRVVQIQGGRIAN